MDESKFLYATIARVYDVFDWLFALGDRENPRRGLADAIGDGAWRILDVCVGTAASAAFVARLYPASRLVGIDLSDAMLRVARQKIARQGLGNVTVQPMSADRLTFDAASFDVVMVSFALHEFAPPLLDGALREMTRVLKPGGRLCILDFARQAGRRNRVFIGLWKLLEPSTFLSFLEIDWRTRLSDQGMALEAVRECSFSNVYVLRRVG